MVRLNVHSFSHTRLQPANLAGIRIIARPYQDRCQSCPRVARCHSAFASRSNVVEIRRCGRQSPRQGEPPRCYVKGCKVDCNVAHCASYRPDRRPAHNVLKRPIAAAVTIYHLIEPSQDRLPIAGPPTCENSHQRTIFTLSHRWNQTP